MDKQTWIEGVLHSADGMSRAEGADILARVQARAVAQREAMTISSGVLWRIAASVVLLIGINVTTVVLHNGRHPRNTGAAGNTDILSGLGVGGPQAGVGDIFFGGEKETL